MRFRATIGSALVLTATWVLPVFAGSSVTPAEGLALDQAAAADLRSPSLAPASDQTVGTPGVDQEQEKAEKPGKPRKPDKAGGKTGKDQKQVAEADKKKDTGFEFVFKERPSFRYGDMFRLDLRLLVQADARQSAQDLESFGGKFLVQRRRFGIQGTLLKVFEYEVEKELDSEGAWRDVFVNVRPVPFVQVQGGKFKVPFGR